MRFEEVVSVNNSNLSNRERTQFRGEAAVAAQRKSAAVQRRKKSIRELGKTLLHAPVKLTPDQLEDLLRFGIIEDKPDLQLMMLCRLASVVLYGEPQYAIPAFSKLLEACGFDARSLDNKADRKLREQELQLRREQFEALRADVGQGSLAKLDALLDSLDATAHSALPKPAVAPDGSQGGGAE